MSNVARRMQRRNRIRKPKVREMLQSANTSKQAIDFSDRVLPRTLLIDVKESTYKVGDEQTPMKDIRAAAVGDTLDEQFDFLKKLHTMADIDKVIMDNKENFKIKTLPEFIYDIASFIMKHNHDRYMEEFGSLPESPVERLIPDDVPVEYLDISEMEKISIDPSEVEILDSENVERISLDFDDPQPETK